MRIASLSLDSSAKNRTSYSSNVRGSSSDERARRSRKQRDSEIGNGQNGQSLQRDFLSDGGSDISGIHSSTPSFLANDGSLTSDIVSINKLPPSRQAYYQEYQPKVPAEVEKSPRPTVHEVENQSRPQDESIQSTLSSLYSGGGRYAEGAIALGAATSASSENKVLVSTSGSRSASPSLVQPIGMKVESGHSSSDGLDVKQQKLEEASSTAEKPLPLAQCEVDEFSTFSSMPGRFGAYNRWIAQNLNLIVAGLALIVLAAVAVACAATFLAVNDSAQPVSALDEEARIYLLSPTSAPTLPPASSSLPTVPNTTDGDKSPGVTLVSTPGRNPSPSPIVLATQSPTLEKTSQPVTMQVVNPSAPTRTAQPTRRPSPYPTRRPTSRPSASPTGSPTRRPTPDPTRRPTGRPSASPTGSPTRWPTPGPTRQPTRRPSPQPTPFPSPRPTRQPTHRPSPMPTKGLTGTLPPPSTIRPTRLSSSSPTRGPTLRPTPTSTNGPSQATTLHLTSNPTEEPNASPTRSPSPPPTTSSPTGNVVDAPHPREIVLSVAPPPVRAAINAGNNPAAFAVDFVDRTSSAMDRDRVIQRFVLAHLSLSTRSSGRRRKLQNDWRIGHECTWSGVVCRGGQVFAIDLPRQNLTGTLPRSLPMLRGLVRLDFSRNDFYGSIPSEFGELHSIRNLMLRRNNFEGTLPTELGGMTSLRWWYLEYNQLSGSFPNSVLLSLPHLREFRVMGNDLTGRVDDQVCQLRLQAFWIDCLELDSQCWTKCESN